MFNNSDFYNLDSAENKVRNAKFLMELSVELEAVEKILEQKGIMVESDLLATKEYIKSLPEMKKTIDTLNNYEESINNYKNNPEQHLRDLLNAKMRGDIK